MGDYRITKRGKWVLGITCALGVMALIRGSIYLAVFGLVISSFLLGVSIYELFFNR